MTDSSRTGDRVRKPVPLKYKIICYIVAWLLALFATDPKGRLWALAHMFPLGLAAFLNPRWGNDGGWAVYGACVGVYVGHAVAYFRSRTFPTTLILFAVLVVLLTCNVSGCHTMYRP